MSDHWYTRDGVFIADADLRIARKSNLYASPTTIIHKVWANPGLDFWKDGELIKAVLGTPKMAEEEMRQYMGRVKARSNRIRDKASDFGKEVHDAIEHYGTGNFVSPNIQPYLDTYATWHEANVKRVIAREIILCDHDLGVAGKADLIYENFSDETVVADVKTQDVKPGEKPEIRQGFLEQLAFYARAYKKREGLFTTPRCQNLLVNSNEPAPIAVKEWSPDQVEEGWLAFRALAWIYFRSRGEDGYWPVGKWSVNDLILP